MSEIENGDGICMSGDCCMVFNEHGNAFDAFEYTPEALEERALELRRERGEVTTVTIGPSPFVIQFSGGARL